MLLGSLHNAAKSWLFKGLLIVIILSFLFAGVIEYFIRNRIDCIAVVYDKKITHLDFEREFQRGYYNLQQQLGDAFNSLSAIPDYLKQLKQQALNNLIINNIWQHYIEKLKLQISDNQIKSIIRKVPVFQKNGHFDNDQYLRVLKQHNYSANQFSNIIRNNFLADQLRASIIYSAFILPKEVDRLFELGTQQREVRLAVLKVAPQIEQQKVTEDELKNYFMQNASEFIRPEQIKVRYLTFSAEQLSKNINIKNSDVESYYRQHPEKYVQAARQNISIIRVSTINAAKALRTKLLAKNGANFAQLAKTHSTEKLTASKGGLFGWVEPDTTEPAFNQAVFKLTNIGEISDVVQTKDGYYILRLNDHKPQRLKSLKQVYPEIAQLLRQQSASQQFDLIKQKVSDALHDPQTPLDTLANLPGVLVNTTDWFNSKKIPDALNYIALQQILFDRELIDSRKNSGLIDVGGERIFVVCIEQYKEAMQQNFEQVSSQINMLVKREKALQYTQQQAEKILLELRAGAKQDPLKKLGITWGPKQLLTRNTLSDRKLSTAIFIHPKPPKGKSVYGLSENKQGDLVLFALDKIVLGSQLATKPNFINDLLEQEKQLALQILNDNLFKKAKIKINYNLE